MSENENQSSPAVAAACNADLYQLDKKLSTITPYSFFVPFRERFTVQDMIDFQQTWEPEAHV